MTVREPAVAGRFYPGNPAECAAQVDRCLAQARAALRPSEADLLGGLVPHAGWVFSGPTAALTFAALAGGPAPDAVCLLGAVHTGGVTGPAAWPDGHWTTPLGDAAIDAGLTAALLEAAGGAIAADPSPHLRDHAIEVQLPFVQRCWPNARILAVAVPPTAGALEAGRAVARIATGPARVLVIASSDLTHYGRAAYGFAPWGDGPDAHDRSMANDRRVLDRAAALDASGVLAEAAEHRNACGAGALAALVACAAACGGTPGALLGHTTSAQVRPEAGRDLFVGYAAMVFGKSAAGAAANRETPVEETA